MKISINPYHVDKMPSLPPEQIKKWWNKFNGDFKNIDAPVEVLIQAIKRGHAYTAQHTRYRKRANFLAGQHVGVDFDTGDERASIDYLVGQPLIRDYASFVHTTVSHTNDSPRSRVVFELPFTFRNVRKYSVLTEAMASLFGEADSACSDPVRIFFGAKDCTVHWLGNVLAEDVMTDIVLDYLENKKQSFVAPSGKYMATRGLGKLWESMLDNLSMAPEGQRWHTLGKVALAAGGYVAGGYISADDAYRDLLSVAQGMGNAMRDDEMQNRIEWGLRTGMQNPIFMEEDIDVDPILANFI